MNDPKRLVDEGATDFEASLLRAGRSDGPRAAARMQTLAALGVIGSVVGASTAAGTATAATASSAAGAAAGGGATAAAAGKGAAAATAVKSAAGVAGAAATKGGTVGLLGAGATKWVVIGVTGSALAFGTAHELTTLSGALPQNAPASHVAHAPARTTSPLTAAPRPAPRPRTPAEEPASPTDEAPAAAPEAPTTAAIDPAPLANTAAPPADEAKGAPSPVVALAAPPPKAPAEAPLAAPAPARVAPAEPQVRLSPELPRLSPSPVSLPRATTGAPPSGDKPSAEKIAQAPTTPPALPLTPEAERAAAAAPEAAAPTKAAAPTVSSLSLEAATLDAARRALLGGDASRALALLDQYQREFPRGQLGPEALLMRLDAMVRRGDRAGAAALARQRLATVPSGSYATRLRAYVGEGAP